MTPVPAPVAQVARLMSTFRPRWCLCGGWAVDAWLGRHTREHVDVDFAIFQDDQRDLFEHLAGLQLIGHDPNVADDTTEPWAGRRLELPAHIHARSDDGLNLDVQLNERSGRDWILSGEPRITVPLHRCARQSGWGVPTVVPEVLLFYKSQDVRPHDELDLLALLPHLTEDQRAWLREAISMAHRGHRWLTQLSP